jgi:hypothetical protein
MRSDISSPAQRPAIPMRPIRFGYFGRGTTIGDLMSCASGGRAGVASVGPFVFCTPRLPRPHCAYRRPWSSTRIAGAAPSRPHSCLLDRPAMADHRHVRPHKLHMRLLDSPGDLLESPVQQPRVIVLEVSATV